MKRYLRCLLLAALAACSNQSEGEFCSTNNQNNDCQTGLICTANPPGITLSPTYSDNGVCCPPAGQPATAAYCIASAIVIDSGLPVVDGSTVVDAGILPDGTVPISVGDGG